MNWKYRNKEITCVNDLPEGSFGFVYEVEFNNGRKYLGSKYLFHNKTLPPLKGTNRKRKKKVESDWCTYIGSFKDKELKAQIKSKSLYPVDKKIIKVCYHAKQLTYWETKYLFTRNCLENEVYYNYNILGKFFKKDV